MIALRFYRMYDIGREVDLSALERSLSEGYSPARTSFLRVRPQSIILEEPPLKIRLKPLDVDYRGTSSHYTVFAHIYDFGAISLCFAYEDQEAPPSLLMDVPGNFPGQSGLNEFFTAYLAALGDILAPHIQFSADKDFFEEYTIYVADRIDPRVDPVVLLTGETGPLSPQMREEILKNSLSYTNEDLAVLTWDGALLFSPEYPGDLMELIEFACVQVLELRYYDRELTRQMSRMYDDIEQADRLPRYRRSRQYHMIMARLMETYAEISEITEKIHNLIKVTEDVYYARVYAAVLNVLRSGQWNQSVARKIEVIQENYSMLSDEVRIQHSNFLEWVIIFLIAFELVLGIWQIFR
ncbi:hypothetical protein J2741_001752 [Methanolinea mesophila]|uniref:hypothetical protein n=1 Tax=Methanolinea mesophila TaxID=547055 RepID=UPI001AE10BBF|nr:hypothetical protein [Methanolinea mesophila]MBP1929205.1 hypothetical protein [Methanolinea mesophila]